MLEIVKSLTNAGIAERKVTFPGTVLSLKSASDVVRRATK